MTGSPPSDPILDLLALLEQAPPAEPTFRERFVDYAAMYTSRQELDTAIDHVLGGSNDRTHQQRVLYWMWFCRNSVQGITPAVLSSAIPWSVLRAPSIDHKLQF